MNASAAARPDVPRCPECGAAIRGATCWLCGRELGAAATTSAADRTAQSVGGPSTYSLSTLFLFITLACVLFGMIAAAPGLGVPLALFITPALIRTFAATRVQHAQGAPVTPGQKIGAFLMSLGIVFLIAIAVGVAFFAACSIACLGLLSTGGHKLPGDSELWIVFGVPSLMALGLGISLLIRTWPRRKRRSSGGDNA